MAQPRPPFVNFFYSITKYTVKHNSFSRIRTQIVKVEGEREHSYNRHYISSKVFVSQIVIERSCHVIAFC